jgi:FtsZ-binding cell division protein ZapB
MPESKNQNYQKMKNNYREELEAILNAANDHESINWAGICEGDFDTAELRVWKSDETPWEIVEKIRALTGKMEDVDGDDSEGCKIIGWTL